MLYIRWLSFLTSKHISLHCCRSRFVAQDDVYLVSSEVWIRSCCFMTIEGGLWDIYSIFIVVASVSFAHCKEHKNLALFRPFCCISLPWVFMAKRRSKNDFNVWVCGQRIQPRTVSPRVNWRRRKNTLNVKTLNHILFPCLILIQAFSSSVFNRGISFFYINVWEGGLRDGRGYIVHRWKEKHSCNRGSTHLRYTEFHHVNSGYPSASTISNAFTNLRYWCCM